MNGLFLLGTEQGIQRWENNRGEWRQSGAGISGESVTSLSVRGSALLAGTRQGAFVSPDFGESWSKADQGLEITRVRAVAHFPETASTALAGTEPAAIFLSRDGGRSWHRRPAVDRLREEGGWSLPYSPEAGCLRNFAFKKGRAFAAVEQGGLLVSDDFGLNWRLSTGSTGTTETPQPEGYLHPDVHSIETHPADDQLLLAACGGGLYRSDSGGLSWKCLYDCYCRAIWLDPDDPNRLILSPADGVNRDGRIEISVDGGLHWQDASRGLDTPWPEALVNQFVSADQLLVAVLSDGEVIASRSQEDFAWESVPVGEAKVLTAAWIPEEWLS